MFFYVCFEFAPIFLRMCVFSYHEENSGYVYILEVNSVKCFVFPQIVGAAAFSGTSFIIAVVSNALIPLTRTKLAHTCSQSLLHVFSFRLCLLLIIGGCIVFSYIV